MLNFIKGWMNPQFGLNYDCYLPLMRCIKNLATGCLGDFILDKHPQRIFVATSYYLLTYMRLIASCSLWDVLKI